jgi:ABC-type branched-subunit amino acid transport system ATPase component
MYASLMFSGHIGPFNKILSIVSFINPFYPGKSSIVQVLDDVYSLENGYVKFQLATS